MNEIEKWQGAVVYMANGIVLPAAHVFEAVDGIAFVAPGYFFKETSHLNNFHRFPAAEIDHIEEWEASIQQQKDAGTALNDYENRMEELGTTYAEQRAELLAILGDELAKPIDQQ